MRKQIYRNIITITAIVACFLCAILFGIQRNLKTTLKNTKNVSDIQEDMVFLGGMPVGIYLKTDGVMVLGTGEIEDINGKLNSPAEHKMIAGDYVIGINNKKILTKKELIKEIKKTSDKDIILSIRRNKEILQVKLNVVQNKNGENMLGIWVRDDVQGLGTVTYIQNHTFAALGHGIHDNDTNQLLEIQNGILYRTNIRSISKGKKGQPGSMEGIIVYSHYNELAEICENNETGIYGVAENIDKILGDKIPIQVAHKEEIKIGDATIRCKVDSEMKEYKIKITHLDFSNHEINKGMSIEVTDPELIQHTGGIVQGMSGSPIIQNGKLIGAVTHVFVKDSKKGYGIFIDTMMGK